MRFGYALVPMDECLSYAAIDLIKRQFHNIQLKLTRDIIEEIPKEDLEHFVSSLAQNLDMLMSSCSMEIMITTRSNLLSRLLL